MVKTSPKFGAWLIGSLVGVIGIKYISGGALRLLDDDVASSLLIYDMALLTLGCGALLCLLAGAFADGSTRARGGALVTFLFMGALSIPAILNGDPIIITETIGMAVSALYLVFFDPIERMPRTKFNEADSASRFGSLLR